MKTHAILAALVLAAPATTLAGHRGPVFFPGARLPAARVGYHSGYNSGYNSVYHSGYNSGFYPRAYCAPRPFLGLSYFGSPFISTGYVVQSPVYRATRSYGYAESSIEADVQRSLRRLGYYRGSIDGDIGPRSRSAIRDFQADSGLPATGRIDGSLLRTLGI